NGLQDLEDWLQTIQITAVNGKSKRIWSIGKGLYDAMRVLRYGVLFMKRLCQPKTVLAARVVALESQIDVLQERAELGGVKRFQFSALMSCLSSSLAPC
ncbi:hypothetical protein N9B94_01230, partial [Verrucomicrobia bacterium]|nr:hypothetical protein [Verrucomicrobiota bacterium]